MNTGTTRKLRPTFTLLSNFLGLGLGYVYVGEIQLAIVTVAGVYLTVAFLSWTRLIVYSAVGWWLCCGIVLAVFGISLVHPFVIAVRNRERPLKRYNRWWFYLTWIVAVIGLSLAANKSRAWLFGYEPFRAPTESMSPTIEQGDFFMANTWRYRNHAPLVGEIVVYETPDKPGVKYVKRIVGVPGDRVEGRDSVIYRNGIPVTESYLHTPRDFAPYGRDFPLTIIDSKSVFVLGDFRDNSLDSRRTGPIPIERLRGRAEYIWFSFANGHVGWDRMTMSFHP